MPKVVYPPKTQPTNAVRAPDHFPGNDSAYKEIPPLPNANPAKLQIFTVYKGCKNRIGNIYYMFA